MDAKTITRDVIDKYVKYVNPTALNLLKMGGFDKVEWTGCGATFRDVEGNEYIDCLGGYGTFSVGHANPTVIDAVTAQMRKLPLSSKTFLNKPLADLAELLARLTPEGLQYSFLCNSGAEAVEGAIKFARMTTGCQQIITAIGSYHGKTLGALSASGRDVYKTPFAPLVPGFTHVPFGDIAALEAVINAETAAVMLEPIQGENGIRIPPDGYLKAVRALCDKFGALLILDEVQTGLCRTGKWFACNFEDVAPDILTLAKALGGGVMPIGAIVGTPRVWQAVFSEHPYIHTSTFGGNEAACVAAITTLGIMEDLNLAGEAARKGERFLTGLKALQTRFPTLLVEARGRGLMLGVEFFDAEIQLLTIGSLVHHGVVVAYTLNNNKIMRIQPPLIITDEQIDKVLAAFDAALCETQAILDEYA
jgi:putrescine aminotransferase